MAARRRKRGDNSSTGVPGVRRRSDGPIGLRKLPPDLEDLATGRRDALRPRHRPRGRIHDTRVAGLIAGVANHESRRVYDARLERLRATLANPDEAALGEQLCVAILLGVWRARNITGFESFAQDVVGLDHQRATALAQRAAERRNVPLERLPDVAVALWMRSEAALVERCPECVVDVRVDDGELRFELKLPLAPSARVAEALASIGRAGAGLARVLTVEPTRDPPRDPPRGGGSAT